MKDLLSLTILLGSMPTTAAMVVLAFSGNYPVAFAMLLWSLVLSQTPDRGGRFNLHWPKR